jgi:hypothetical protein
MTWDDFPATDPAEESYLRLERLLQEIDLKWADLAAATRGLSEADLEAPGVVGEWSVRETLAHIAAWEQEGARRIDLIVNGGGAGLRWPDRQDENEFNAAAVAACRGLSTPQVVRRLEDAHRDFTQMVAACADELATAGLPMAPEEWIAGWTYLHYEEHAPQIWAYRSSRLEGAKSG